MLNHRYHSRKRASERAQKVKCECFVSQQSLLSVLPSSDKGWHLLHPDHWNLWLLWQVQLHYIPSVCTTHIQDSLCIQNMKAEIDKVVPDLKCTYTLIKSNNKSISLYFSKKAWMTMCITLYTVKENGHSYHNSLHLQRRRYLWVYNDKKLILSSYILI